MYFHHTQHNFLYIIHPYVKMERAKGLEPSTFSLATRRSTTELCPLSIFNDQFKHIEKRLQDEMSLDKKSDNKPNFEAIYCL